MIGPTDKHYAQSSKCEQIYQHEAFTGLSREKLPGCEGLLWSLISIWRLQVSGDLQSHFFLSAIMDGTAKPIQSVLFARRPVVPMWCLPSKFLDLILDYDCPRTPHLLYFMVLRENSMLYVPKSEAYWLKTSRKYKPIILSGLPWKNSISDKSNISIKHFSRINTYDKALNNPGFSDFGVKGGSAAYKSVFLSI